jgi:hypothetical protein
MNASMPLGENNILMGCDNQSVSPSISKGNYFYVIANTSTREETTEIFGKLSVESIVNLARKILLSFLFLKS